MRGIAGIVGLVIATAACAYGDDEPMAAPSTSAPPTSAPTTSALSTSTAVLDPLSCPVSDAAFCETAVAVVDALAAGDAATLLALSRRDRIECAGMNVEYVPACATSDVIEGHGLSGPDLIVNLIDEEPYEEWIAALTAGIDPSFSDELGAGAVRPIGVGTCGPDIPGRRTYHVAWTAGLSADRAASERVLGSFELTFADDEWLIALSYLGTLADWEAAQDDPLRDAFCEAGRSPWSP